MKEESAGIRGAIWEMDPGIWLLETSNGSRAALMVGDMYHPEGGYSIFWIDDILAGDPGEEIYADWVENKVFNRGKDVTAEYLRKPEIARIIAEHECDWLNQILEARPHLKLSKEAVANVNCSEDKAVRLLAVKYMSGGRVERGNKR